MGEHSDPLCNGSIAAIRAALDQAVASATVTDASAVVGHSRMAAPRLDSDRCFAGREAVNDFYDKARQEIEPWAALDDERADPLKWWHDQTVMERARALRAEASVTQARSAGAWGRECALVALRMLKRAGKLKASTDDERKVLEWAADESALDMRGAQRRLGSPFDELYSASADANAQAVLFDAEEAA